MTDSKNQQNKETIMSKLRVITSSRRRIVMAALAAIILLVLVLLISTKSGLSSGSGTNSSTFTVQRDDLVITVTEGGDIKALNSKDIKSEVEGRTTIISIVDEGTYITQEDVNNGKVLVELDSSELTEELAQREIDFAGAEASFTEAKEAYDIQLKQNESDITTADLKVRFASMDLHKYLGAAVVERFISKATNPGAGDDEIGSLIEASDLGGEALQKLRELDADIKLKRQGLELAKSKLEWTEKLYEKEYVSLNDKEADSLDKERKEIDWEKAERVRAGQEAAKNKGKRWGGSKKGIRKKKVEAKVNSVLALIEQGVSKAEISRVLGISIPTIHSVIKKNT